MFNVSAEFLTALRESHRVVAYADVLEAGLPIYTLDISAGQVTIDATAAVRRRCSVTLHDEDLTPGDANDLLAPFGNELVLYRGILFPDGTEETVPLGIFRVSEPQVSDAGGSFSIQVDGWDRARTVQRARFTYPYVVNSGTNYAVAIRDLISSRVPGLTYNLSATTRTTPLLILGESTDNDPWKAAQDMAASIGMVLYFDQQGIVTMKPEPDPSVDPVVDSYVEGVEAKILSASKRLSDEQSYNHVVVIGEADGVPVVRAEAVDDDPNSPTFYLGPYGDVPYFYVSKMVTSVAQAQEAADALLRKNLGAIEQVGFSGIVNPALDVGDTVQVSRARSKIAANYVIDSLTIPLSATQPMTAGTRKRRL